jgi:tRNA pseudouridine38-40 synthase
MPRYKIHIEYDGQHFSGFQAQDDLPTVQGRLEWAINKFSGETVRVMAAGRTDRGRLIFT